MAGDDRVLLPTRILAAAIVPFLVVAFVVLYGWPGETGLGGLVAVLLGSTLYSWAMDRRGPPREAGGGSVRSAGQAGRFSMRGPPVRSDPCGSLPSSSPSPCPW